MSDFGMLVSSARRRGDKRRALDRKHDTGMQTLRNEGASNVANIRETGATGRQSMAETGQTARFVTGLAADTTRGKEMSAAKAGTLSENVRQFEQGRRDTAIKSYMTPEYGENDLELTPGLSREGAENKYSMGQKLQSATSPGARASIVDSETRRKGEISMRDMDPEQRYGMMTANEANKRAYADDISAYDKNKAANKNDKPKVSIIKRIFGGS